MDEDDLCQTRTVVSSGLDDESGDGGMYSLRWRDR